MRRRQILTCSNTLRCSVAPPLLILTLYRLLLTHHSLLLLLLLKPNCLYLLTLLWWLTRQQVQRLLVHQGKGKKRVGLHLHHRHRRKNALVSLDHFRARAHSLGHVHILTQNQNLHPLFLQFQTRDPLQQPLQVGSLSIPIL